MKTRLRTGLFRTGIVISISAAIVAVLVTTRSSLREILHWFEFLSSMPGLSGGVILVLSLATFLLLLFVARWVFVGFAGQSDPSNVRIDSENTRD